MEPTRTVIPSGICNGGSEARKLCSGHRGMVPTPFTGPQQVLEVTGTISVCDDAEGLGCVYHPLPNNIDCIVVGVRVSVSLELVSVR
jgi:hypothetical protein